MCAQKWPLSSFITVELSFNVRPTLDVEILIERKTIYLLLITYNSHRPELARIQIVAISGDLLHDVVR